MRIVTRYIVREVFATGLVCVVVLTALLLLGNVLREVLELLAHHQMSPGLVARAVLLLVPFVAAFSVPIALLTAVFLVFGRLSSDHELDALRANGISLTSISLPVFLLALVLSGVCAWFNLSLAPKCRQRFKALRSEVIRGGATTQLLQPRSYTELRDLDIYVGDVRGTNLSDILVYQYQGGEKTLECRADRGWLESDSNGWPARLVLAEANALQLKPTVTPMVSALFSIELPQAGAMRRAVSPNEMSFRQLRAARIAYEARGTEVMPLLVQMHRQVAFSLSCLGFALMGIPLAVRVHRRDANTGVALALVLTVVYYAFEILGEALQHHPSLRPHLMVWIPNLLFLALGFWLIRRCEGRKA